MVRFSAENKGTAEIRGTFVAATLILGSLISPCRHLTPEDSACPVCGSRSSSWARTQAGSFVQCDPRREAPELPRHPRPGAAGRGPASGGKLLPALVFFLWGKYSWDFLIVVCFHL